MQKKNVMKHSRLLITGGAGFIGSNLCNYFLSRGYFVTIFDNFKRFGTIDNLNWIKTRFPQVKVIKGDIRNESQVRKAVEKQDIIFHLAAQVAVTSSVIKPKEDFDINAYGTFNLLEAVRSKLAKAPIIIFASTNKVYGEMEKYQTLEKKTRYIYKNSHMGISEKVNLDFHSPYGCSKGAADQYVHDYARIYDIPTVVFRQSCIYGPRQFGVEDQGWIAWFIIASTLNKPVSIYGDGKQVRDVLYIDDLVRLFEIAVNKISIAKGKIYNVGGGIDNTLSVWYEFGPIIEKLFNKNIKVAYRDWRPGDQKVYISDIRKIKEQLSWVPQVKIIDGITKLFYWVKQNKSLFTGLFE